MHSIINIYNYSPCVTSSLFSFAVCFNSSKVSADIFMNRWIWTMNFDVRLHFLNAVELFEAEDTLKIRHGWAYSDK
jgi:hypothetical protein